MPSRDYRIYRIDRAGRILGAAADLLSVRGRCRSCASRSQLRSINEGVSVWQEARLVQELEPKAANPGLSPDLTAAYEPQPRWPEHVADPRGACDRARSDTS